MQIDGFWERVKFLVGWNMPAKPNPEGVERRIQARLAWNGWPDSANARKLLSEHEARDPQSAAGWDRVIVAVHKPPPGFVIVPIEPTRPMLKAACSAMSPGKRPTPDYVSVKEKHKIRYRAMIEAVTNGDTT